jgi:Transposase
VTGSESIPRRRKWKSAEKAALLAEVEAEGGKVVVMARRHGISERAYRGNPPRRNQFGYWLYRHVPCSIPPVLSAIDTISS